MVPALPDDVKRGGYEEITTEALRDIYSKALPSKLEQIQSFNRNALSKTHPFIFASADAVATF